MIVCRPLEPPEWTELIMDNNLTDWHKELWKGEKVKMLINENELVEHLRRMLMKAMKIFINCKPVDWCEELWPGK